MIADPLLLPHNVDPTCSHLISRYFTHTNYDPSHIPSQSLRSLETLVHTTTPVPDRTTCSSVPQTFPTRPLKRSIDAISGLAASDLPPCPTETHQQPLPTTAPTYLDPSIDITVSLPYLSIATTDSPVIFPCKHQKLTHPSLCPEPATPAVQKCEKKSPPVKFDSSK